MNRYTGVDMATANDLSDYQQISLRAIRSLFESIEQSSEGTVIVDRDLRIVWMNERYARRFGLPSAKSAIGQVCEQVIPGSLLREVVNTGQPILLDLLDTPKGPMVVMRLPIHDDTGQVIGAIGFALFDELRTLAPLVTRFLRIQEELASTRRSLQNARQAKYSFAHFVGSGPASQEVKRRARRAATVETSVLLLGETGTGKELLAHAIHAASPRANKSFVSVNAAAIPENLLEAEFFGTAPGAFTGADRKARAGKLQIAQGGTLFLDEIGDMPLSLQAKLLRVLQEKEFEPLGSNEVLRCDVRLIAATSRNLDALVAEGSFRADLYYRLNILDGDTVFLTVYSKADQLKLITVLILIGGVRQSGHAAGHDSTLEQTVLAEAVSDQGLEIQDHYQFVAANLLEQPCQEAGVDRGLDMADRLDLIVFHHDDTGNTVNHETQRLAQIEHNGTGRIIGIAGFHVEQGPQADNRQHVTAQVGQTVQGWRC